MVAKLPRKCARMQTTRRHFVTRTPRELIEAIKAEKVQEAIDEDEAQREVDEDAKPPRAKVARRHRLPQECSNPPCKKPLNATTVWRHIRGYWLLWFCQWCSSYANRKFAFEDEEPELPKKLRSAEAIAEGKRRKLAGERKKKMFEDSDEEELDGDDLENDEEPRLSGDEPMYESDGEADVMEQESDSDASSNGKIRGRASRIPSIKFSGVKIHHFENAAVLKVVVLSEESLKVTWTGPNGKVLKQKQNRISFSMKELDKGLFIAKCSISNLDVEDNGIHICHLENSFSYTEATIYICNPTNRLEESRKSAHKKTRPRCKAVVGKKKTIYEVDRFEEEESDTEDLEMSDAVVKEKESACEETMEEEYEASEASEPYDPSEGDYEKDQEVTATVLKEKKPTCEKAIEQKATERQESGTSKPADTKNQRMTVAVLKEKEPTCEEEEEPLEEEEFEEDGMEHQEMEVGVLDEQEIYEDIVDEECSEKIESKANVMEDNVKDRAPLNNAFNVSNETPFFIRNPTVLCNPEEYPSFDVNLQTSSTRSYALRRENRIQVNEIPSNSQLTSHKNPQKLRNSGSDCFVNCAVQLFLISARDQLAKVASNLPIIQELRRLARRESDTVSTLRQFLTNVDSRTEQGDVGDVVYDILNILPDNILKRFEVIKETKWTCTVCQDERRRRVDLSEWIEILTKSTTFDELMNREPEIQLCKKCSAGVSTKTSNVEVPPDVSHLLVHISKTREGVHVLNLNIDEQIFMFNSNWRFKALCEYVPAIGSAYGSAGHYVTWMRGSGCWHRISDSHIDDYVVFPTDNKDIIYILLEKM